jgi:hypothetical protein
MVASGSSLVRRVYLEKYPACAHLHAAGCGHGRESSARRTIRGRWYSVQLAIRTHSSQAGRPAQRRSGVHGRRRHSWGRAHYRDRCGLDLKYRPPLALVALCGRWRLDCPRQPSSGRGNTSPSSLLQSTLATAALAEHSGELVSRRHLTICARAVSSHHLNGPALGFFFGLISPSVRVRWLR